MLTGGPQSELRHRPALTSVDTIIAGRLLKVIKEHLTELDEARQAMGSCVNMFRMPQTG
jgi:hypothetical protein